MIAASSAGPLWYLLLAPATAVLTVVGIWYSGRGERRIRAEETARQKTQAQRIQDAIFGYTEGGTTVPGIQSIVVGDPVQERDSLATVARAARDQATEAAVLSEQTRRLAVENGEKIGVAVNAVRLHAKTPGLHPAKPKKATK